jgi:hypothetical protein
MTHIHIQVLNAPKIRVYLYSVENKRVAQPVEIYTKNINKLKEIAYIVREYFKVREEADLVFYLHYDKQPGELLTADADFAPVHQKCKNNARLMIYSVLKPQKDEDIAMFSYHFSEWYFDDEICGFPRIFTVKKELWDKKSS